MFSISAEFYDLIYARVKDYAAETSQIADLLRKEHPGCKTVLDVACGTGEHARRLAQTAGLRVDGLDLNPELLRIARRKHPEGRFFEGDMSHFQIPHRYDAITCLFSSIAYALTLERVEQAFACFRDHLATGGLLLLEPWFAPGVLDPSSVSHRVGEASGVRVERTGTTQIDGQISRIRFDYSISDSTGTHLLSEVHELGLFTSDELLEAFRRAGFRAEFDPYGLTGRGLYLAKPDQEA